MRFWNYIEFLTKCHQPHFSSSSCLEMASKSKVIPLLRNGQNISSSFLSIFACQNGVTCLIDLSIFHLISALSRRILWGDQELFNKSTEWELSPRPIDGGLNSNGFGKPLSILAAPRILRRLQWPFPNCSKNCQFYFLKNTSSLFGAQCWVAP